MATNLQYLVKSTTNGFYLDFDGNYVEYGSNVATFSTLEDLTNFIEISGSLEKYDIISQVVKS